MQSTVAGNTMKYIEMESLDKSFSHRQEELTAINKSSYASQNKSENNLLL